MKKINKRDRRISGITKSMRLHAELVVKSVLDYIDKRESHELAFRINAYCGYICIHIGD